MSRFANRYAAPLALSSRSGFTAAFCDSDSDVEERVAPVPAVAAPETELITNVAIDSQQQDPTKWWLVQKSRALAQELFLEDCLSCKGGWKLTLLASNLGAGADTKLHGFVMFKFDSTKGRVVVNKIAVPLADRRHGFGRRLMNWVITFAQDHPDARSVALSSLASSIPFYQALGFRKTKPAVAKGDVDDISFPGQVYMELTTKQCAGALEVRLKDGGDHAGAEEPTSTVVRIPEPKPIRGVKSKKRVVLCVTPPVGEVSSVSAEDSKAASVRSVGLTRSDRIALSGLDASEVSQVVCSLSAMNRDAWSIWVHDGMQVGALASDASLQSLEDLAAMGPHAIVVCSAFVQRHSSAVATLRGFTGALILLQDEMVASHDVLDQLGIKSNWRLNSKLSYPLFEKSSAPNLSK